MQRLEAEVRELMTEEELAHIHTETNALIRSEIERMRAEDTEAEETLLPALCNRVTVDATRGRLFDHAYNVVVMTHRLRQVERVVIPFFTAHMGPRVVDAMQPLVDGLERRIVDCVEGYCRELSSREMVTARPE